MKSISKGFKIYLIFITFSFFLFSILYNYLAVWIKQTNFNSALYLLSSLIQSEAAVLGIVVTLSLIAIQLTASSYSRRVINLFGDSPSLWILVLTYIIAIIYGLGVLKFTTQIENFSNNEFLLWIAYLLGIYAFLALIPYIIDILDLMKPSTIINRLTKKITKESVSNFVNKKNHDDPLQPVIDILFVSLLKYDYGTLREGLKEINSAIYSIFDEEKFDKNEINISYHIFEQLFVLVHLTAEITRDKVSTRELINIFKKNGAKAAEQKLESSALKAIYSLAKLGKVTAEQMLLTTTNEITFALEEIGVKTADQRLKKATPQSIQALEDIALVAIKKREYNVVKNIINSIEVLGLAAIQNNLKKTPRQSIYSLEKIGIESSKIGLDETLRRQTILSLGAIGKQTSEIKKFKETTRNTIHSLQILGESATDEGSRRTALEVIRSLRSIGTIAAKNQREYQIKSIIKIFIIIGNKALENGLNGVLISTIKSLDEICTSYHKELELPTETIQNLKKMSSKINKREVMNVKELVDQYIEKFETSK